MKFQKKKNLGSREKNLLKMLRRTPLYLINQATKQLTRPKFNLCLKKKIKNLKYKKGKKVYDSKKKIQ